MKTEFAFYEIVRIVSKKIELQEINGLEGPILGKSQDENSNWYYGISLLGRVWCIAEIDLIPTGRHITKSEIYSDDMKIKVSQDGTIKD